MDPHKYLREWLCSQNVPVVNESLFCTPPAPLIFAQFCPTFTNMNASQRRGHQRPICRAQAMPRMAASSSQLHTPVRSSMQTFQFHSPIFHEHTQEEDNAVVSQQLLKLARNSGTLNLSSRGLAQVPERIYSINEGDKTNEVKFEEMTINEDDAWWNQVPLNTLDLSSNALSHLSPKLENLNSLTTLTLHDNALLELPGEIGKLEKLIRLNVSHNKLSELPRQIYTLPELRHLNVSYNKFVELDPDISDLHMLEFLDASHNNIQVVPGGIGFLVRLTVLLLSFNHIKNLPDDFVNMRSLQKLDLMQNDLTELPMDIGLLRKLQCLYVQHNDIVKLPSFEGSEELYELHAANNFIETISKEFCLNLSHLKILDLRDNKMLVLPDEISLLRNLTRLDVSNNDLTSLPVSLSNLPHLISLKVDGNPIKNIRRDILQRGTTRILKTLQDRAQKVDVDQNSSDNGSNCHRLQGGQNLFSDNYSYFEEAHTNIQNNKEYESFNNFDQTQPEEVRQQHQMQYQYTSQSNFANILNNRTYNVSPQSFFEKISPKCLSYNSPHAVHPRWVNTLRHTRTLAVNNENLSYVPDEVFSIGSQEQVHVVDFSRNQFTNFPAGLQHMSHLLTELVFANNRIRDVPSFISQFTRITFINLMCNQLVDLPKEFGVLNTLRELNISNNRFEYIPNALYELQNLEILIASDNRIKSINASECGIGAMKRLTTLDLRNNDIMQIPAVLGNITNITTLEIIGNPFRQPRHQILERGTDAIMSYLRDRIPM